MQATSTWLALMTYIPPDESIVADHALPNGHTISVRRGWIHGQAWCGEVTIALATHNARGERLGLSLWAVSVLGDLVCLYQGSLSRYSFRASMCPCRPSIVSR